MTDKNCNITNIFLKHIYSLKRPRLADFADIKIEITLIKQLLKTK